MKLNYLFTWLFALITMLISSGCSAQHGAMSEETVPFTVARNYFLNNNAPKPVPAKVNDKATFERLFGMATFMGRGGQPTPIDFQKEFVIAVALPESDRAVDLKPLSLKKVDGRLVFTYRQKTGEERRSFTIQPLLLIVVDKQREMSDVVLVQK